jgi:hypothetical protein
MTRALPSFLRALGGILPVLLLLSNSAYAKVSFDLQGAVPASITRGFLDSGYHRILSAIAPDRPAADTTPVSIIYYTRNDSRKLGVRLPEWGGGGAIGRDTIIVPVDKTPVADMTIDRVTLHELVHIALERSYGRLRLPRWFHEGVAMTLSGEISFEEQAAMSRAVFARRLLPLDTIENVNRFDGYVAAVAYSQSHLTVIFIIATYGMDAIPELLSTVRKTGTFDSALMAVFGLTPQEFERLVFDDIHKRYRYLFLIGDTWLYWLAAALLAVVAFFAVRLRNKKRQAQMEQEESAVAMPPLAEVPMENDDEANELCEDGTASDDDDEAEEEGDDRGR